MIDFLEDVMTGASVGAMIGGAVSVLIGGPVGLAAYALATGVSGTAIGTVVGGAAGAIGNVSSREGD
ncbi:hypothetical protein LJC31_08795 [Synergistaceae bacterium OttesenSCG-928-I11]|nr:hypothetical protein [Synergistaceae bacterium OttesenSCG-928-I11]